jgi:hypothetical protein
MPDGWSSAQGEHMINWKTAPEHEFLTIYEVAEILRVNRKTVSRRFAHVPGVINIGTQETMHTPRRLKLLIPRDVLIRFLAERRVR